MEATATHSTLIWPNQVILQDWFAPSMTDTPFEERESCSPLAGLVEVSKLYLYVHPEGIEPKTIGCGNDTLTACAIAIYPETALKVFSKK